MTLIDGGHSDDYAGLFHWRNFGKNRRIRKTITLFADARPSSPLHEFGHFLGFQHQSNSTHRIMSYAPVGHRAQFFDGARIKSFVEAYR